MTPGSIANLFADDSPAFRAEFEGPVPEPVERYWRGPVFWNFDGQTWSRSFVSERGPDRLPGRQAPLYHYRVQLEPNERRWLFTLDYPVSWPTDARLTADYQLLADRPVTRLIGYEVVSQPRFIDTPELPMTLRLAALALPTDRNPRTRAHARALRDRYSDDRKLIAEVLDWLRREPFFYSLDTAPLGRHGVDEFLFELRTGYCEYYASAFAVLMRSAGIPARIVTGYQGGYQQPAGGYLLVRNSDAHAWVEVWLEGAGWTRVDPTAAVSPARIHDRARNAIGIRSAWWSAGWIDELRNRYDRLQHLWNRWVLNYDAGRQRQMLERLGLGALSTVGRAGLVIVVLAGILTPLVLLAWRRRSLARLTPVERLWQRLLKRLGRRGLSKQVSETPLEYLERIGPRLARETELRHIVEQFIRLRYGREGSDQPRVRELKTRIRQFRTGLIRV